MNISLLWKHFYILIGIGLSSFAVSNLNPYISVIWLVFVFSFAIRLIWLTDLGIRCLMSDLTLWKLKTFYLTASNFCVAISVLFALAYVMNISSSVVIFGGLLWLLHTFSKWFAFPHPKHLIQYAEQFSL